MIMKRILYYIWILPLMLSGCEKDLMDYEGLEGVYFAVQWGDSWGSEKTWPYQPYTNVNFISLPGDTATLSVKVMASGPVKTYDRIFLVEVNPDSTDLTENVDYLPLTREGVIKAGESAAEVEVRLIRTDILQEKEQRLGLRLVANEYFSLAFPEWDALIGSHRTGPVYEHFDASLHTLRIADFMVEPKVWVGTAVSPYNGGYESGNWGAFSRKKLELICERFNLTYNDFMSNETMPSALQMLIYKSMSTYLIQCYNDKKPVLEEDGRLMWFSGCPWLSKVGVPWVPEEGYYD